MVEIRKKQEITRQRMVNKQKNVQETCVRNELMNLFKKQALNPKGIRTQNQN